MSIVVKRGTTGQIYTNFKRIEELHKVLDFTDDDVIPSITNFLVRLNSLREVDVKEYKKYVSSLGGDLIVRNGVVYAEFNSKKEYSLLTQGLIRTTFGILMLIFIFYI